MSQKPHNPNAAEAPPAPVDALRAEPPRNNATPGSSAEQALRDEPTRVTAAPSGPQRPSRVRGDGGVRQDENSRPDDVTRVASSSSPSRSGPRSGSRGTASGGTWDADKPHVDDYVMEEEIHRGGQGVVYRALQIGTKRQVALKVLLEGPYASDDARRRFEREVELAASLKHPNIVTILDSGISQGRYYFAMEYIDGLRLDHFLRDRRPPMRETLELLERICQAVNFAHQRGVIHRDLKPSNILVDKDGQPHVLDFGLAKHMSQYASGQTVQLVSTTGQILGTVAYMSPEQAAAPQDVDVRSDVYSLGVIFYESLLGQPPYPVTGSLGEVLNNIASLDPVSPRTIRMKSRYGRDVDDELATIMLKALEKEPPRRYQSVGNLGRDIRRYLDGEPIDAKRASGFYIIRKTLKRHRVFAASAGAMLLMILAFMVIFAFLYKRESAARDDAERARTLAGEKARAAEIAREQAMQARGEAEKAAGALRESLTRQEIQQGDLARERGDLAQARDSYWHAFVESNSIAAKWNLRQYYFESGELGAQQLYLAGTGPAAVSPDGKLAAACNQPNSVSVCRLEDGAALAWYPTPGPVTGVVLDDSGRLAVAGRGWARVFDGTSQQPAGAPALPADFAPDALFLARGGDLLLMNERMLVRSSGRAGVPDEAVPFKQPRSGRPDYSPVVDAVAVPTREGVSLLRRGENGRFANELIWKAAEKGGAPRAAKFAGDEVLAVLTDTVQMVRIGAEDHGQVIPFLNPSGIWDFVDVGRGAGTLVLGNREGEVALYRSGKLIRSWRTGQDKLQDVHFVVDEGAIVTLDARGALTRWAVVRGADRRRTIVPKAALDCSVSLDGSAAAILDAEGRVTLYSRKTDRARAIGGGRMLSKLPGAGMQDVSMSLTADGEQLLIRRGDALSLVDQSERRPTLLPPWKAADSPVLRDAAISGDGAVIALRSETSTGDRQRVTFVPPPPRGPAPRRVPPGDPPATMGEPIDLTGGAVRWMAFWPGTRRLLLIRANGEIDVVEPGQKAIARWAELETSPSIVAIGANRLSVAAADDSIRVLDADAKAVARIHASAPVVAMSFSPAGDMLLVRLRGGDVRVYEIPRGEPIMRWSISDGAGQKVAAWLGEDTLLLETSDGVTLQSWRGVDPLIERNARFAQQRATAQDLAEGDADSAWTAADRLRDAYAEAARTAKLELLEMKLRRPTAQIDDAWFGEALGKMPAPGGLLRLAHAAYAGRRYDTARGLLQRGMEAAGGSLDAYSHWRLAQCDYLLEDFLTAAARFAQVVSRADLDAADLPAAQLQLTASLHLAGQDEAAREAGMMIGVSDRIGERADRVGLATARSVGRFIAGVGGENLVLSTLGGLLTNLSEGALNYQDDPYFFFGEAARKRGATAEAAAQYRRCIDLARDDWPSNWAQWRLKHMAAKAGVE